MALLRRRATDSGDCARSPEAELRSRQIQATVFNGALGGGMLLAGFGLIPALIGMTVGATLGYLLEKSVDAKRAKHPA